MNRTITPNVIAGLAARLDNTQDRETYAALVSYVNELPPGDEFRQLMEMLGLVSIVGQRIPDAVGEFLAELRSQTKVAADYHGQVDARLAGLPQEIAAGVDPAAVARAMSENLRQQLADTGLQDTTALLASRAKDIRALAGEILAGFKPAVQDYRGIASTISNETTKLVSAARDVEVHNERLIQEKIEDGWLMKALVVLIVFLLGGFCGILVEKRQTGDALANIGSQIEMVQTPALPIAQIPPKNRKSGL